MAQEKKIIHLMGTVIEVVVEHDCPLPILEEVESRLKMYEQRFSANDSKSDLGQVNQAAGNHPVKVHPELFDLAKIGLNHSCAPGSNLNVAIGPLVQTWRIGFSDAKVPTKWEIQELLHLIDPEKVILDEKEQTLYLSQPGMKLDLGALAKGYIADRIIDYLKEEGVSSALINLGGNLVVCGPAPTREDGHWRIGVQNPTKMRGASQVVLKVLNKSVVTSGIYERRLEKDNHNYHHILDPQTGFPIETELASLTIVSDLSVDGEIWTTRLFGKSVGEIMNQIEALPGIEGLIITQSGQLYPSSGLKEMLV